MNSKCKTCALQNHPMVQGLWVEVPRPGAVRLLSGAERNEGGTAWI